MAPTRTGAPFAALDPDRFLPPKSARESLFSPALVVHLPVVRANVRRVIELTGGPDRWRPHLKTTKLPTVWRILLDAGLQAFKCATVREASVLLEVAAKHGVPDVDLLVAYPHVEPALSALAALARKFTRAKLSVLCEDEAGVAAVPDGLGIFVDVDSGMRRTGVPLVDRDRVMKVARAAGSRFRGVHAYEGHLHGADARPRARQAGLVAERVRSICSALKVGGIPVDELVTSGTPAFRHALAAETLQRAARIHRVSPGTVVFHDLRSELDDPELGLVPAAMVFTRVVSRPRPEVATCDAGSKSIATGDGDPCAVVLGHPELEPQRASEEHLPLKVAAGEKGPERGEALLLVPRHVCPTVNLAEEALLVDEGGECFVEAVAARAHDLMSRTPGNSRDAGPPNRIE